MVKRHWRARTGRVLAGTAGVLGLLLAVPAAPAQADRSPGHVGWWYDALKVDRAHTQVTGEGATVAVIDTAIDPGVPELRGADVELRIDCLGNRVRPRPRSGDDHGTSMAALIAGTGKGNAPGGVGVRGIAPDARILFYSIDSRPSKPGEPVFAECDGTSSADMIRDAVRQGADVISISMRGLGGSSFEEALQEARDAGLVIVASAGDASDEAGVGTPASIPGVVAVNAVDRSAKPWEFNPAAVAIAGYPIEKIRRAYPVISAPGVDVKTLRWQDGGWRSDVSSSGTSAATALVAGSLALVKQKYPEATGDQLIQNLIHFTGGSRAYAWDEQYGFGIVALNKMLDHDPTGWPDQNPLLLGPTAALRDFPMSVWRNDVPVDEAPRGEKTEAAASPATEDTAHSDSGTVPGWLWATGGAVVVVAAGAAVTSRTRHRRSMVSTLTKSEV